VTETHHGGAPVRGQDGVPHSPLFEGRFGRMFRLEPLRPSAEDIDFLVEHMRDAVEAPSHDNPRIPAGYTYLGQFIDHDITFDPMSELQKRNDPNALVDFRTPRFDLDSLYGSGPSQDPFLYEAGRPGTRGVALLVGINPPDPEVEPHDLPRNQQGRALIGDPRNDVHVIIAQLHLLFIRFHNKVVDQLRNERPELQGPALLTEAQRVVRWHYQWIVVHDFLERVAGREMAQAVLGGDRRYFDWAKDPFMPVEFSGAAYRFGHSMIRPHYDLNAGPTSKNVPIFAESDDPGPFDHLGGFRPLPFGWTIDWSLFFKVGHGAPQLSRKIDTKLSPPLFRLPGGVDAARHPLANLNLRRGRALGLPSGQDVAEAMEQEPLTHRELGLEGALGDHTPLWYYLLREAQVHADGEHLGPVGGRIVAEVLVGLLDGDPQSYRNQKAAWRPTLPAANQGDFTMEDLVTFATS
jgi:Animal haem peroxidase